MKIHMDVPKLKNPRHSVPNISHLWITYPFPVTIDTIKKKRTPVACRIVFNSKSGIFLSSSCTQVTEITIISISVLAATIPLHLCRELTSSSLSSSLSSVIMFFQTYFIRGWDLSWIECRSICQRQWVDGTRHFSKVTIENWLPLTDVCEKMTGSFSLVLVLCSVLTIPWINSKRYSKRKFKIWLNSLHRFWAIVLARK